MEEGKERGGGELRWGKYRLLNPIYNRTAAGGHFGREDFPWENVEHMSDLAAYIV